MHLNLVNKCFRRILFRGLCLNAQVIHNDTRELGKTKLMKMQQVASFLFIPSFTVRYTTSISNTVYQNTNSHS